MWDLHDLTVLLNVSKDLWWEKKELVAQHKGYFSFLSLSDCSANIRYQSWIVHKHAGFTFYPAEIFGWEEVDSLNDKRANGGEFWFELVSLAALLDTAVVPSFTRLPVSLFPVYLAVICFTKV